MSHVKRKYVRKCKVCRGTKEYILIQEWQGKEFETPVRCHHCDENGNEYDNQNRRETKA